MSDVFKIVTVPDPVLRDKAQEVARMDEGLVKTLHKMHRTMMNADGIGLAANQVGRLERVIVVDMQREGSETMLMANPKIIWASEERAVENEGCLSIPGYRADVERPAFIRVRYLDPANEIQEREADGLLAACIQHEIDHLDGILYIDHISRLKRDVILRKLSKDQRLSGAM